MKFIRRRTGASRVTVDSLGIRTDRDMWNAIAQFTGYNMALIEPVLREQYALALLGAAKKMGIAPNPAWQRVIDDPGFGLPGVPALGPVGISVLVLLLMALAGGLGRRRVGRAC